MSTVSETSDDRLIDLLREKGAMSVSEMAVATSVTSTAVRQRLNRLMGQGLIERDASRGNRGRPSHRYSLSEKARRQAGNNFADLAIVLWNEIRAVKDPEVRKGLLSRLATNMAAIYRPRISGGNTAEKMDSLANLLAERRVPVQTEQRNGLAVLNVKDCPYPELAEQDRGICAVEKMMFSQLLEQDVKLSECRLEGFSCCRFETN